MVGWSKAPQENEGKLNPVIPARVCNASYLVQLVMGNGNSNEAKRITYFCGFSLFFGKLGPGRSLYSRTDSEALWRFHLRLQSSPVMVQKFCTDWKIFHPCEFVLLTHHPIPHLFRFSLYQEIKEKASSVGWNIRKKETKSRSQYVSFF